MDRPLANPEIPDASSPTSPSPELTTFISKLRARTKPLAFAVICSSLTLDSFNVTSLTYGQLNIAEHYDVIVTTASWSLSAYALAFGSLLLLAGRAGKPSPPAYIASNRRESQCCQNKHKLTRDSPGIGDMYGHKFVYSYGLVLFSIFAVMAASIDSNFVALCIFRALQGASAAATVPTAYAMVGINYKGQARELAVAGLGVSSTAGAIMGSIGTRRTFWGWFFSFWYLRTLTRQL